ncbi:MAG TPA: UDP-N-acetylmuramoyl-L-alanine--D-glutamate ligase [Candidatus Saccharimonadales bacterium]|nr:UDP-N-acetylmuramoyl-L-alanine--D-glutamate ligase [Candidatus Saccharimonadales bacterium]
MSEKPVVVIGAGRSGLACARTLSREGNRVILVDRSDSPEIRERVASLPGSVEVRLGGYGDDVAADALMVCPSPGVPWDAPELEIARAHGVPVRSEMDLVFERCRARICGITGTNGKTTTTALVAAIFERAGERVHLGGNIGMTMLDRLDAVVDTDWVVLELSSFQIESVREPRCAIACVLNVTPDHLDRHGDFEAYAETKRRLVRFALDDAVLGFDDPVTREMATVATCRVHQFGLQPGVTDGATRIGDDVVSVEDGEPAAVLPVAEIPLFGEHNLQNVLAAVAVARAAGLGASPIAGAVRDFHAVAHRLQTVRDEDDVLWVNDSKATNVESAVAALRSFPGRTIVWIGGGIGAGTPVAGLADEVVARARHAILNGASAPEIEAALAERGFTQRTVVATLADAVRVAEAMAQPGDVVLLAPGYKSFDQFRDFEHRGDAFAELVAGMSGHAVSTR